MQRAQLFVTCMVDLFRPRVGAAAVRVLARRGVEVEFPPGQTCCGQFAYNAGHHREAAAMGRQLVRAFERADGGNADDAGVPIVALSGSCAAMVAHETPGLLERDALARGWGTSSAERWRRRADAMAERVVEFSTWLDGNRADEAGEGAAALPPDDAGTARPSVACHTGCHMRRLLRVTDAPLHVIESAGAEAKELPDADQCCGFGGTFGLAEPAISGAMADAKLDALATLRADGAASLVSSDLGCLMQLGGRLSRRSDDFPVLHLAELVDLADRGSLTLTGMARAAAAQGAHD